MEIDIKIDKITDCLEVTLTGEIVPTHYKKVDKPIEDVDYNGWKFDWARTQRDGYTVFELYVDGVDKVQGRISMRIDGGVADIDIVEAAPENIGHDGTYTGVGAHLFAIACQYSYENGCDGVVAFTAKSDLIGYYHETIGAELAMGRRMYLDEKAASILIHKYIRKE